METCIGTTLPSIRVIRTFALNMPALLYSALLRVLLAECFLVEFYAKSLAVGLARTEALAFRKKRGANRMQSVASLVKKFGRRKRRTADVVAALRVS